MQISGDDDETNPLLMLQLERDYTQDRGVVAHNVVNDEGIKTALIARSVSVSERDQDDDVDGDSSSEEQQLDHDDSGSVTEP